MVEYRLCRVSWFNSRQSKAGFVDRFSTVWNYMDHDKKLAIYRSQVGNVRALESSIKHLRRSINFGLRSNQAPVVESFTKFYAVAFCAWAEANFSKVIHTPYGFNIDEIHQINLAKVNGIGPAWKKAVEIGIRHLDARRGSFQPNTRQTLERAIDAYVFDPSLLRNKLAHGQWITALNRDNSDTNAEFTTLICELDLIKVDGWRVCHLQLANTVEMLIESPKKTFVRDWWKAVQDLKDNIESARSRTLAEHVAILKDKDVRTDAIGKRRGR